MLEAFFKFTDYFWNKRGYTAYESVLLARLAVISAFIGLFIPLTIIIRIPLYPERYYPILASIWLTAFMCLLLIKYSRISIQKIVLGVLFVINISLQAFIYFHGTNFNSTTHWFITPVLIAFFILGRNIGIIFFLWNLLSLIFFQVLFKGNKELIAKGWDYISWETNYLNDQVVSYALNFITVFIFIWLREQTNRKLSDIKLEIMENEKSLLDQARMAELGEVSGNIAHEVNNPLAVISGNAQVLRKQVAKGGELNYDRVSQCVDKILMTTERISRIIKGLKNYSRDATNDPFEDFFVAPLIMEVQEMVVEKCMSQKVQLLPAHVRADISLCSRSSQVFQILIILLNNAIDAIEEQEGSWVRVDVTQNQSTTTISVIDSGQGISPELEEKVFTAFFTTKTKGKGTGLGLSIAKKLMFSLNGEIHYDRNHENSCFNLVFPNS